MYANVAIHRDAAPLSAETHLDPLMERIGDARFVLIDEASHGTHEYSPGVLR